MTWEEHSWGQGDGPEVLVIHLFNQEIPTQPVGEEARLLDQMEQT